VTRHHIADVRFGSLADICAAKSHVRFTPENGHTRCKKECPLRANSGHALADFRQSYRRSGGADDSGLGRGKGDVWVAGSGDAFLRDGDDIF
jgi:hypothetical protein